MYTFQVETVSSLMLHCLNTPNSIVCLWFMVDQLINVFQSMFVRLCNLLKPQQCHAHCHVTIKNYPEMIIIQYGTRLQPGHSGLVAKWRP